MKHDDNHGRRGAEGGPGATLRAATADLATEKAGVNRIRLAGRASRIVCAMAFGLLLFVSAVPALSQHLGDLDHDGLATVLDLVRLQNHLRHVSALNEADVFLADVDEDGFVNETDVTALGNVILGLVPLKGFPLAKIREASPADGEGGVSVNRETIFRLTLPLSSNAVVNTSNLFATFGGRRILSRVDLSSDRRTVTLFYLEPVPASARIRVTFDGAALTDFLGRAVDLDGDGVGGGAAKVDFDTLSITPVAGTAVIGHVYASEPVPGTNSTNFVNLPLRGVLVSVDGAEERLWTRTDANGYFRLEPVPAGRFFVHVDGRSAVGSQWPGGAYYPVVGKAWEAVAGRTNNLAGGSGEIFLPLIQEGSLQAVSITNNTVVTFAPSVLASNPWLAGVSIDVPANSLFSDNGTRGGRVGIAPVAPDRLPEPLPPGLNFPLVITVQSDGGLNFDRPVPVRFPNLPDPVTGLRLPPGAKSELWSFNHDTGRWEMQGLLTVSEDGLFVVSDPGVGIRQPGWHAVTPTPPGSERREKVRDPAKSQNNPDDDKQTSDGMCDSDIEFVARQAMLFVKNIKFFGLPIAQHHMGHFLDGSGTEIAWGGSDGVADMVKKTKGFFEPPYAGIHGKTFSQACADLSEMLRTGQTPTDLDFKRMVERSTPRTDVGKFKESDNRDLAWAIGGVKKVKAGGTVRLEKDGTYDAGGVTFQRRKWVGKMNYELQDTYGFDANDASLPEDVVWVVKYTAGLIKATGNWLARYLQIHCDAHWFLVRVFVLDVPFEYPAPPVALPTAQLAIAPDGVLPVDPPTELILTTEGVELPPILFAAGTGLRSDKRLYYRYVLENGVEVSGVAEADVPFRVRLPANTPYNAYFYMPSYSGATELSGLTGESGNVNGSDVIGQPVEFLEFGGLDSDGDGIPDLGEKALGTDPDRADTDRDGVPDGAEITQDTNPLDGVPVITGVIAASDTPGNAVDVCTVNDLAFVADSEAGVVIFNIADRENLTRIAQVDTPGIARAVACSGNLVAVADDTNGLAIIDITDPPAARIIHQVRLGGEAQAVTVDGAIAYVGLASGMVVAVDIASGTVLDYQRTSGAVQDLAVSAGFLYILNSFTLQIASLADSDFRIVTTVSAPGSAAVPRRRLFMGGGLAYASHSRGYNIFRLTEPTSPLLQRDVSTTQFGWHQMAANGSGLGIAAMGVNSFPNSSHDVWLYGLNPGGTNNQFLTSLPTPGAAQALSIYNGLAYVADGNEGLQVVNYITHDSQGVAPIIQLTPNFSLSTSTNGAIEEGQPVRLAANVTDDVQVGIVEFYVNGQRVLTDGNFPFEHRFVAPSLSGGTSNFTVRARAVDTGGNATWSEEIMVRLLPDVTPPRMTRTFPAHAVVLGGVSLVAAYFNEPIRPATLNASSFLLVVAGADGIMRTSDDFVVTNGVVSYREDVRGAFLTFATNLTAGFYAAHVLPPIADLAGNAMTNFYSWFFWVVPGDDSDQDGVPDDVELTMGLDPQNPDTNLDGIWDGDEDMDGDGLATKWEIVFGYNPRLRDSDANGIPDDREDLDHDGLLNRDEILAGTNPRAPDTDGDGWIDEVEVVCGADPLEPASYPSWQQTARPPIRVLMTGLNDSILPANTTVARPPVSFVLPGIGIGSWLAPSTTVAKPPVSFVLPGIGGATGLSANTTVARPPVGFVLPSANGGGMAPNTINGKPPVTLRFNTQ